MTPIWTWEDMPFRMIPSTRWTAGTDHTPAVRSLSIDSEPASGGTYTRGERIRVFIYFDEELTISGFPRLALTIGAGTQFAIISGELGQTAPASCLPLRGAGRRS